MSQFKCQAQAAQCCCLDAQVTDVFTHPRAPLSGMTLGELSPSSFYQESAASCSWGHGSVKMRTLINWPIHNL